MDKSPMGANPDVARTLDHELELVRGAIALVAAGGAPRVRLASLRFGEQLLEPARRLAAEAGVRLTPEWTSDEGGASLIVEPLGDV